MSQIIPPSRISFSSMRSLLEFVSNLLGNDEWRAISAIAVAQEVIGFVIILYQLRLRIEIQGSSEPVRGIRQVHQPRGDVPLLDGRIEVFLFPADHAGNEICKIVFVRCRRGRPRLLVFSHPAPVPAAPLSMARYPLDP